MSETKQRDLAKETFDWKGKAGADFAKWNPTDVEGTDRKFMGFVGQKASDVIGKAVKALEKDGLDVKTAKGMRQ